MSENPRDKIEDLKKVAGGADSGSGIDSGSGQPPSDPDPKKVPGLGDGGSDPSFGDSGPKTKSVGK